MGTSQQWKYNMQFQLVKGQQARWTCFFWFDNHRQEGVLNCMSFMHKPKAHIPELEACRWPGGKNLHKEDQPQATMAR